MQAYQTTLEESSEGHPAPTVIISIANDKSRKDKEEINSTFYGKTTNWNQVCNGGLVCAALAVFAAVFLPGKLSDKRADDFAAPLFNHEMPDDARLIQASAAENEDGSTSATIIMQTEWTEEEILAHYSDTTYLPAAENDEVTLQVLPLDDSSIEAVKQADLITLNVGSNDIFTTTLFAVAAVLYAETEIPEDVQKMAEPVLAHRLVLSAESRMKGITAQSVVMKVLKSVPVPVKL